MGKAMKTLALLASLPLCALPSVSSFATEPSVEVIAEIADAGKVVAQPRVTVPLGSEGTVELAIGGGAILTYSVIVTRNSDSSCYLTKNAVIQRTGDKKTELKSTMVACDGKPVVLRLSPKMSGTERSLSVTVVAARE
jgi:hypothetical protein